MARKNGYYAGLERPIAWCQMPGCNNSRARFSARDGKRLCRDCRAKLRKCDCQNPPPHPDAEGTFHVSESCPIHGTINGFTPFTTLIR